VAFIHARKPVEYALHRPHYRIEPGSLTAEHPRHEPAQGFGDQQHHQQQKENLQPSVRRHQNFSGRNMA
jgi:hypothetical protein